MNAVYNRPDRRTDLTGKRIGKLLVIERAPNRPSEPHRAYWLVQCECGSPPMSMRADYLRRNPDPSCGCNRGRKQVTHGASKRSEYRIWQCMRQRCSNPKTKWFHNYGGRGIRVCKRWETSFEAFFEDMGPRPSREHTLDRVDNDGHYEPGNVRWATRDEQMNNIRSTIRLTIDGVTRTISEWAAVAGIPRKLISHRLELGWRIDTVLLSSPSHKKRRNRSAKSPPAAPE